MVAKTRMFQFKPDGEVTMRFAQDGNGMPAPVMQVQPVAVATPANVVAGLLVGAATHSCLFSRARRRRHLRPAWRGKPSVGVGASPSQG